MPTPTSQTKWAGGPRYRGGWVSKLNLRVPDPLRFSEKSGQRGPLPRLPRLPSCSFELEPLHTVAPIVTDHPWRMNEPDDNTAIRNLVDIRHHAQKTGTALRTAAFALHPRSFWQRRFYDFNVWSRKKRIEKLNYMHRNPVKRGLVAAPQLWLWSSYRFYQYRERNMCTPDRERK
jgi:hypothetical protein